MTAKFLVSNSAAGSVIGKGGVTITEFQTQSQSRIQLSKTKMYFPGTTDRVLLITGSVNAILTALHLMLSKLQLEESGADPASGLQAGLASSPIQPARPDRLGPSQLATATGSFHMSKPVERIPSFSRQSGRLVSVTL